VISWKNSFKRLNEEYELAKKKKQAVDNLYITGKISQFTRDSFIKDITATIVDIERQQKDLVEKMQLKTDELSCQIKTLESLLANYEIQHVIGEIEEEAYQRDILLLTAGIDAAKNELETIKHATMQLCAPVPTIQAPIPPELPTTAPAIETPVMECPLPQEETPQVEISLPIETPVESALTETPIFEATPAPITETLEEQTFATEALVVVEEPVMESAPVEVALFEDAPVVVEESVMESTLFEDVPVVVEEPVMESAPVEESTVMLDESTMDAVSPIEQARIAVEEALMKVAFEDVPVVVEEPVMESAPVEVALFEDAPIIEEAAPFTPTEFVVNEPAIEIATTEPVFLTTEPTVEAPLMDYTPTIEEEAAVAQVETIPTIETSLEEAVDDMTAEQIVADVPLQVFEVTQPAPIEQTLEKVMEQLNSPVVETLTVEELTHDSHPSTAPHQAPSDIITEAVSDGQIEESDEDTTE